MDKKNIISKIKKNHLSKEMVKILRHSAEKMKIHIHTDGYINLADLVPNLKTIKNIDIKEQQTEILQTVNLIVQDCKKQRFSIRKIKSDKKLNYLNILSKFEIRANQGHSMKIVNISDFEFIKYPEIEIPTLFHGTFKKSVNSIMKYGLNRMKRNNIHLTEGFIGNKNSQGKNIISGIRNNCQIIILIDTKKASEKYHLKFFRSSNKVILCPGNAEGSIPPDCLSVVEIKDVRRKS
jgi:2'-phosphotransferase